MSIIKLTLQCLLTPRLYKIYSSGPNENRYQPHSLERWADNIVLSTLTFWNISLYASPLICIYMYKKDLLTIEGAPGLAKLIGMVGIVFATSLIMRGVGRATNPKYQQFVRALMAPEAQRLEILRQYDFEFSSFPVTYVTPKKIVPENDSDKLAKLPWYRRGPMEMFAALVVRMFGLRLIYPGTLGIVHSLVWTELIRGRTELVQTHHGKRHKIRTADGNEVDAMFVDNRKNSRHNGSTLVVCCEGNSGFYEIGIMSTPLAGGYSVLGWNHPGFGGSTGLPYPEQEQHAIEAVMEFANRELGFPVERIVVFGWSIGGYTAAWAAKKYPNIQCLVLDATFDDLLPLAVSRMPSSWGPLVSAVVRYHVNLNVGELVMDYPGPLRIIRRVNDEIICIREGDLSTNCGNALLMRVIRQRHPELIIDQMEASLEAYLALHSTHERDYAKISSIVRRLVNKYLKDYKSSHCTGLPIDYFDIPSHGE